MPSNSETAWPIMRLVALPLYEPIVGKGVEEIRIRTQTKRTIMMMTHSVFEDLGFPPNEAENLRIRSDLMISLRKLIRFKI